MSQVIRSTDKGDIIIPHNMFQAIRPNAEYEVEEEGNTFRVNLVEAEQPLWATLTPEEWVKSFLEWMNEPKPAVPHLPDEALRRENMYD